jgi:hypothetical protein
VLVALFAAVAVVALVLYLGLEGPDQSQVGVVTTAGPHRVCVGGADGDFCAHVDGPDTVAEIEVGECIELRRSSDEIVESARPSDLC